MHCGMAKFPRRLHSEDWHGDLTTFSGNPEFASLEYAQDSHHHDDTYVFPVLSLSLSLPGWPLRMAEGTSHYRRPRIITYGNSLNIFLCNGPEILTSISSTGVLLCMQRKS